MRRRWSGWLCGPTMQSADPSRINTFYTGGPCQAYLRQAITQHRPLIPGAQDTGRVRRGLALADDASPHPLRSATVEALLVLA